jgi:hypothetical protein
LNLDELNALLSGFEAEQKKKRALLYDLGSLVSEQERTEVASRELENIPPGAQLLLWHAVALLLTAPPHTDFFVVSIQPTSPQT